MPDSATLPFVTMDLEGNPGVVTFQSPKEFQEWLECDLKSWAALKNSGNFENQTQRWLDRAVERMRMQMTLGRNVASIAAKEEVDAVLDQYRARQIIHHNSPLGIEIQGEMRNGDAKRKRSAALTLAISTGEEVSYQDRSGGNIDLVMLSRAAVRVRLFEIPEFRSWFEDQKSWVNHVEASIRDANQRAVQASENTEQKVPELKDAISKLQADIGSAKQSLDAKLSALESAAKEWLRLDGVYTYWEAKKERHSQVALFSGIVLMAALFAVLLVAWNQGDTLLPAIIGHARKGLEGASNTGPALGIVVATVFAVPLLAGMWLLRLIGRIFFTNLALSADASERMVMLKTFLALTKDGNIDVDKDRSLILQALFRAGPGAGSDDGLLSHPLEAAAKQLGGKGKE